MDEVFLKLNHHLWHACGPVCPRAGSFEMGGWSLWPYHPECAGSHLVSEAKQGRAWLVLGWEIGVLMILSSLVILLYCHPWEGFAHTACPDATWPSLTKRGQYI